MSRLINLIGEPFGRLTVLSRGKTNKHNNIYWFCECSCGNIKEIMGKHLKSGKISSCGCYHKEVMSKLFKTHGMTGSSEYITWKSMKIRCYNPDSDRYDIYGGRGIVICDRWLNSFENFYEDMGLKPSEEHSIDRINVNGNYDPNNCRWATDEEQIINRRTTKIEGKKEADHIRKEYATGEFTRQEIADYYGCGLSTIENVLNNTTWI
jgi:hypothetical protein